MKKHYLVREMPLLQAQMQHQPVLLNQAIH